MKKAIFTLQNGGESYKIVLKNTGRKDDWGFINGKILIDYQLQAVKNDLRNDGYKIEIRTK